MSVDVLDLARAGDGDAFRRLVEPYERELQAHCYRMLGSVRDAEDALQEALLAAWQGLGGFEGRASVRTWLYRIVTTRCLNARRSASRRQPITPPPGPRPPEPTRLGEVTWLEPYPDVVLEGLADAAPGPEARYEAREAISLAFITAVQRLPPRQRAVLILRDVLGFAAFGSYLHGPRAEAAQGNGLLVLTLTGSRIHAMTRFGGSVLPRFGLPPS